MDAYDVVVIGAGAAGLVAAGTAAERGLTTLLVEKMEKPARKVRITGKGRCNITNMRPEEEFLSHVRAGRETAARLLDRFSNRDTVVLFESLHVPVVRERGDRIFPASGKAWDVAEALVRYAREVGAEIRCHTRAERLLTGNGKIRGIVLRNESGKSTTIHTPAVIVATGGVSYPATGSTGDGYRLAREAGHTVTVIRPSLVPFETEPTLYRKLDGLHLRNIRLSLTVSGREIRDEFGEVEFVRGTVTGPCVLRLSREAVDAMTERKETAFLVDLKPALSEAKLLGRMERELTALGKNETLSSLLRKMLLQKLIPVICRRTGIQSGSPAAALTDQDRKLLIREIKRFRVPLTAFRPFKEAIVTAGGIPLDEINPHTMESLRMPGLFFAGEVLDMDADTGGYNLQLAFSSGKVAGESVPDLSRS